MGLILFLRISGCPILFRDFCEKGGMIFRAIRPKKRSPQAALNF